VWFNVEGRDVFMSQADIAEVNFDGTVVFEDILEAA
jgi:hypothetical protein